MMFTKQICIFSILKSFTRNTFVTFCLALISLQLLGQTADSFEDNDLTSAPLWLGKTEQFSASAGVLQLNAPPVSGKSYLSTVCSVSFGSWSLFANLKFNPSGSNFCRWYLMSNTSDLDGPVHGYFVQIGSASDDVSLYRQEGEKMIKIIDGPDGMLNLGDVSVSLRVSRDTEGKWILDTRLGPQDFERLGEAIDLSISSSAFAGLQCTYTSTRSTSFIFDDFSVESVDDTNPPQVISLEVMDERRLLLTFSEPIDASSIRQSMFEWQGQQPLTLSVTDDSRSVTLSFSSVFPAGTHTLIVHGVPDKAGNEMARHTIGFSYIPPVEVTFKDVVITEIMADYSPAVSLPEVEYVEIFNRSDKLLPLEGWIVTDGSGAGTIPKINLNPGEYAVLTIPAGASLFNGIDRVLPIPGFPSLNNTKDVIILKTSESVTIDSVLFDDSWYHDSSKKNGGWSLEIIDPDNFCEGIGNWSASESEAGGTPGMLNSVDAENLDLSSPEVLHAFMVHPDSVVILFSETMQSNPSASNFMLQDPFEIVGLLQDPTRQIVSMKISPPLEKGHKLSVEVSNIFDCAGNELNSESESLILILPAPADSMDVVLNEILFNPYPSGNDFVEIRNTSSKYIDVSNWRFGSVKGDAIQASDPLGNGFPLIIGPDEYAAFSENKLMTLNTYPLAPVHRNFSAKLPPFNDDQGTVVVLNADGRVMDRFTYTEDFHSPFLKDVEGVSLERITARGNDTFHWKSASAASGFATPGYRNSNDLSMPLQSGAVNVVPEIFAPGIGQPDFASINYSFDNPGYIGTVKIYDARSREIKTIVENQLLGTSGGFRWDGDTNEGTRALVGLYMILFEVYNSQGVVHHIKKRVAVAADF